MPVARMVYMVLHALIWGGYYAFLIRKFIPLKKEHRIWFCVLVGMLTMLSDLSNNLLPEDAFWRCMNDAKNVACEVTLIILVWLFCQDNPWKSYAHLIEANIFYVIFQIIFSGCQNAMYHSESSLAEIQSFMDCQPVLKQVVLIAVTIGIVHLLQHFNLFGRIPYQIWMGYEGLATLLTLCTQMLVNFSSNTQISQESAYNVLGVSTVLPFLLVTTALIYKYREKEKERNNQLKEEMQLQYEYYKELKDKQTAIRELRHDLLNHLETMRYVVNGKAGREEQYQQQLLNKMREMGGKYER